MKYLKEEILKATKEGDYKKLRVYLDALCNHLVSCCKQYDRFKEAKLMLSDSCRNAWSESAAKQAETP